MATRNADQLWNPYTTLDLHSLGCDFSCVGSAIRKGNPRCTLRIRSARQQQARQILDAMAVEHPSSRAVTTALQKIVHLLLCSRFHQKKPEQMTAKFSEWLVKVHDVAVELKTREMVSQIQQLTADLSRCQEAQGQLESELTASRVIQNLTSSRIMTQQADLAARNTELRKLQDLLREKDTVLQNHQSSATAETSALQRDLETTDAELQETRRQLQECQSSFEKHQSSVSSQIIELRTALKEAEAQTTKQSSANISLEAQLQEVLKGKESDAKKTSALQHELNTTKAELNETQRQLHESNKGFEEHQSSASSKILKLETAQEEAQAQISKQSRENSNLEAQLQDARTNYNRKLDAFKKGRITKGALSIYVSRRSRIWYRDTEVE